MREAISTRSEYIDGNGFTAEVIRTTGIKSAHVRVREGAVSVVAPLELPQERITQLLASKRHWIKENIHQYRAPQPVKTWQYTCGETFPYLGRSYRLMVQPGPLEQVKLIKGKLVVTLPCGTEQPQLVRNALVRWYKCQAQAKLREKAARLAKKIGVKPATVGVKMFKSRWGNCCSGGHIDFNWRIVMAPNPVVDYVVLHELCHLIYQDHSALFWREVKRHMPDFEERREWLQQNANQLSL